MTCSLSTAQLHLLRSVATRGWPTDLLANLLPRCSASEVDWADLRTTGLIEEVTGRFLLSLDGRRALRQAKKTRHF